MLFYQNIVFCFDQKYTVIYFCQYHVWLSEKKNVSSRQWPNITMNSFDRYTQVFFITTTYL